MKKFSSDYHFDKRSGLHLHENINVYGLSGILKNCGALVGSKGEKFIQIAGLRRVDKDNAPTEWVKFNREFKIGDTVKTGSYNLIYTGKIIAIGVKTVTIEGCELGRRRFDIAKFICRNYDLNLDKIQTHNFYIKKVW